MNKRDLYPALEAAGKLLRQAVGIIAAQKRKLCVAAALIVEPSANRIACYADNNFIAQLTVFSASR